MTRENPTVPERLATLEAQGKGMREDVQEIKEQVLNHIPTLIAALDSRLTVLNGWRNRALGATAFFAFFAFVTPLGVAIWAILAKG